MIARLFAVLAVVCAVSAASAQAPVPRGSPLRAELMDAMRPTFERETGGPVEFVVRRLTVWQGWAFADVRPQRPGGAAIDWRRTRFRGAVEQGVFGGDVSFALLERREGRWALREVAIGPTDVAWIDWQQRHRLPEALFGD